MKVMTQHEGVIEFDGWQSSPQDCLWHVLPGNGVRTILFNTTGTILYGTDTVAFFASPKAATPLKEYGSGTDKEIPEVRASLRAIAACANFSKTSCPG